MRIVQIPNVRVAADLAAATTANSKWVPCFGARAVIFEWSATNANQAQNAANQVESSNADDPTTSTTIWTITPAGLSNPAPPITGFTLNGLNPLRCVILPAPSGGSFISERWVRMNVLGHATLIITGLACTAYVIYDGEEDDNFMTAPRAV